MTNTCNIHTYRDPGYAQSLSEFGAPLQLRESGGWLLVRTIPGCPYLDAIGTYPLLFCLDWSRLASDLEALDEQIVSVCFVTEPFATIDAQRLAARLDVFREYKAHFVADLSIPLDDFVSKSHLKRARRALTGMEVCRCERPVEHLSAWCELYKILTQRHSIQGIRTFSSSAFAQQLRLPGIELFLAMREGRPIGANLICVDGDVAYTHLSAFSDEGYRYGAAYGVRLTAMESLAARVRWLSLGAGSGIVLNPNDGLSAFKAGWSSGTRIVYFGGYIRNEAVYNELLNSRKNRSPSVADNGFFPAYRDSNFE